MANMTLDPAPAQADADYLTGVLRSSGALVTSARVTGVTTERAQTTVLSRLFRLRLAYDGDAEGAPSSLILKTVHPERAQTFWFAGAGEVSFYRQVGSVTPGHVLPQCHEAHYDPQTKAWHLLLEDLTDSHYITSAWPLPPSTEDCIGIVRTLARFHASWWDDPRLGSSVGSWIDSSAMDQGLADMMRLFERFCERQGDRLSPVRRSFYERLLATAPDLMARYHARRHMTIAHGDAHVWNCFLPRAGTGGEPILFDWDSWRVDPATDDLAYMMALHWYPDRRRQLERPMLDVYHETIVRQGVAGYSRQNLDDDYRWSVLLLALIPIRQWSHTIPPVIWWNNLERVLMAVEDLGCRELLD